MYLLMNKNNIVAEFEKSKDALGNSFQLVNAKENRLPLGFESIDRWLDRRQAAKHREHLRKLMAECGCLNSEGFIKFTHATSLNDSFWVKSTDENVTWEKVSLYQNEFNEVISKISFEGSGLFGMEFSSTTPEFSTEGSFEKCWKREEGEIFLFKRGSTGARNTGLEPYSEIYASQLASIICKNYVKYDFSKLHKKDASKCKLFTSDKNGFVPFSTLFNKKVSPREMLDFYARYGCEDDFRRMLVFDAVTFNTDRHSGNHGVVFDNDTLRIIRMAPVFDFNQALLPYAEESDLSDVGLYLQMIGPRIGEDFVAVAKSVMTSAIKNDLINLHGFHFEECIVTEKFSRDRINSIETIINKQIKGILDKGKLYTVNVFPDSVVEKLRMNQKKIMLESNGEIDIGKKVIKENHLKK